MERTVPSATSDEIQLFRTTLYSLLRSTTEIQIRTLEQVHAGMNSLLHPHAKEAYPDVGALIYCSLRLPECIQDVKLIILGQSEEVFSRHGFSSLTEWKQVAARARRRRCYYDGNEILACFIASRSDIEDVIPALTAYQIEWNKINTLLKPVSESVLDHVSQGDITNTAVLVSHLGLSEEDFQRLQSVWGNRFIGNLRKMKAKRCNFRLRLLSGSLNEYRRATQDWWTEIEAAAPDILTRPVYFISSNPHSVPNILSGFAFQNKDILLEYLYQGESPDLLSEWRAIQDRAVSSSPENFLYYLLKKYQQSSQGDRLNMKQLDWEKQLGITRIINQKALDIEVQIIEINRLNSTYFDPRINHHSWDLLRYSDAYILNIDYPLGQAAYTILSKVAEQAGSILGIYVMGKAATLNGIRGDVMIPNVVQDEHSRNTYLFQNVFTASDVSPYLVYGSVLDNQKAISVHGTFLQNASIMDIFYREGYADIEMEAGPYLSSVYEMYRPKRHPIDEIVNLYGMNFDLGILHYASDTPLSKGANLGAGTLSYYGMDSTYATALAILKRILEKERERLKNKRKS